MKEKILNRKLTKIDELINDSMYELVYRIEDYFAYKNYGVEFDEVHVLSEKEENSNIPDFNTLADFDMDMINDFKRLINKYKNYKM